jgi:cysteine-rich repeat protein
VLKNLTSFLILMVLCTACWPTDSGAVNLTCTLPNSAVPRAQELCEELRVRLRVRSSAWNNNVCASEMLRIGLLEANRVSAKAVGRQAAEAAARPLLDDLTTRLPKPISARCGDAILDTEGPFNEQCDDGNQEDGDGCDSSCQTE